jgi:uncharacterized protein YdiU (UPF0061 family)
MPDLQDEAPTAVRFAFDNSYARDLPEFAVPWPPAPVPEARLLFLNRDLAEELGLDLPDEAATLAGIFSGSTVPEGAAPIAQAYAGHQFGQFSPQLGDGRAVLLGEIVDRHGCRRDLAFKGSGRTPFSRRGDGMAAVGPMLREVLQGEAMHALGIPTTRALAVAGTNRPVYRERALPGAVLTRVAASHIRVGTFEYFAARGLHEQVRRLADYSIARHYPELPDDDRRYPAFLRAVAARQAELVARWMGVGFIHGMMNTDNMSIAGETIDYGPCAFMEAYDPRAAFSSIDAHGRYAYGNQPYIAQWNLARLAETLLPLLAADEERALALATAVVDGFAGLYRQRWLETMRRKLGLAGRGAEDDERDAALAEEWLALLQANKVDFTLAWRKLADAAAGDPSPLRELFPEHEALDAWLARWQDRCAAEDRASSPEEAAARRRAQAMRRANPWIIPRNHRVEEALSAASEEADLGPFERLLAALRQPYDEQPGLARYAEPAPAGFMDSYRTFCGT